MPDEWRYVRGPDFHVFMVFLKKLPSTSVLEGQTASADSSGGYDAIAVLEETSRLSRDLLEI